ncbi:MAG TPA: histidinol-phosphate transaminase [Chitinophagaceae bacterium]|nr:histidinol-phosphate transaminase [Chitinophagaceae bacterium]
MKFELDKLVRDNIRELTPYSSARNEFKGEASVFLDANENSYGSPLKENFNRYPDPLQSKLKNAIALIKHAPAENIFIGNGSDEVIDLAYRIFCDPGKDNVIICPPTYGMYEVCANINDVEIRKVHLTNDFQLDVNGIISATDQNTKLLFLCSPNNPTGNIMIRQDVDLLIKSFPGIVIVDEAYINYSTQRTFIEDLPKYPNLIVMQTLSKAWGLASLRIGLAFASLPIVELLNKVKPPYNINQASQQLAIEALQNIGQVNDWMKQTIEQRDIIRKELATFSFVKKIYESDANFLLVKVNDANNLHSYLATNKIIVRNRSKEAMCDNCLRITIGTPEENLQLLKLLRRYEQ